MLVHKDCGGRGKLVQSFYHSYEKQYEVHCERCKFKEPEVEWEIYSMNPDKMELCAQTSFYRLHMEMGEEFKRLKYLESNLQYV